MQVLLGLFFIFGMASCGTFLGQSYRKSLAAPLPDTISLGDGSCAVLAAAQLNRQLGLIDPNREITQEEYDATAKELGLGVRGKGTAQYDVVAYWQKRGYDVFVFTLRTCEDYATLAANLAIGCSAAVILGPDKQKGDEDHIEAVTSVYFGSTSDACWMTTNSWGDEAIITGFEDNSFHHSSFTNYKENDTFLKINLICEKGKALTFRAGDGHWFNPKDIKEAQKKSK